MTRKHTNPLLIKAEVGQRRETVYDLPPEGFVYGITVERKKNDGAAQVLQNWQNLENHLMNNQRTQQADYIVMNREGAKDGVKSAKDVKAYRAAHPVLVKAVAYQSSKDVKKAARLPSDNNPRFTYGLPTRPSSPVSRVLNGSYQREWEQIQRKRLDEERQASLKLKERQQLSHFQSVHGHHTASESSASAAAPLPVARGGKPKSRYMILEADPKTLFQIQRFKAVPPRVTQFMKPTPSRASGVTFSV